MTDAPTLPRDLLAKALGNPRLVAAFEQQAQAVQETQASVGDTVAATGAIQDATVITLSTNEAFTNERVLEVGAGITIDLSTAGRIKLRVSDEVPHVAGGFTVQMTAQGVTNLVLPLAGTLATRAGVEALTNKTLVAPLLATVSDYADDAAAATGGVPVGGMYRTASAVKVRVS